MTRPKQVNLSHLGYGNYLATVDGQILTGAQVNMEFRPLKPWTHPKTKRPMVTLSVDGKTKRLALARLILTAFGKPSPGGRGWEPTHKNGDVNDCQLSNLKWMRKAAPDRERIVKLVRSLIATHQITPDELL